MTINGQSQLLKSQVHVIYRVGYIWYRMLSIVLGILLTTLGFGDWLASGRSILGIVLMLAAISYLSFVLWSCPDFLSDRWERKLSVRVREWRPSLIWLVVIIGSMAATGAVHPVIIILLIRASIPSLLPLALPFAGTFNLFTLPAIGTGAIRLFVHMRAGKII